MVQLSSCRRLPFSSCRHRGHAGGLPSAVTGALSGPLRLSGGRRRDQAQCFAHLGFDLRRDVLVVLEELAGVLAALANAFALVAEPRARLLDNVVVHREIEQVAFFRDALAVKDVEFRFAEGRGHLVLHDLYFGREPVTMSPSLIAAMRRMSTRTEA